MDFLNQQFNQFNQPKQPKSLWQQTMRARYGFAAGIVAGIFIGWFFHGVVSFVVRLGIIALLLIPLIIIAWFFLRARSNFTKTETPSGGRVFTIGNVPPFMRGPRADRADSAEPQPSRTTEPVIELNEDDYDLERFKKRLEQEN
jgi:F0F1-type ATP synthase assembly protein I